ncbi:MAG: sigma-70 family RNA polymerase sigma factor [Myxococcales bacterium]|nr:sigma-70 family RNA polymerase sigma factor [Myxococcales bacterium]
MSSGGERDDDEDEGAGPVRPAASGDDPPAPKRPARRLKAKPKKARVKVRPEGAANDGDDDKDDDEDDEDDAPGSTIVDVSSGPSMATLPSMPASVATASVPALRGSQGLRRASPLDTYLSEMGRYPLLTPDEERELTMAYYERQDATAARKLVVHNLRLVVKMAYKYRRAWANVLDLIQEGNVGLVEAVQRFDPYKGAKFSTYATFWIRAYMLRYLLEHSRTVRISRTRVGRKLFFQLSRERAKLQAMGIEPSTKLLAERLEVAQEDLEEVVKHMDQAEVRLDAPLSSDDPTGGTLLDGFSAGTDSPEAEAFKREFASDVSAALESFAATLTDEREKVAWEKHLMAEDPVSLSELGEQFGVTKQRMGQIVGALRKRLKAHLIRELGPEVELDFSWSQA